MKDERLQRLTHFVDEVRRDIDQIEARMDSVNSALNEIDDIVEAEQAHSETVGRKDARDQLNRGETYELVIEDPPGEEGPDAVARIDGIVTFVSPQALTIEAGDTVQAKLTNVGENHANAVATDVLES